MTEINSDILQSTVVNPDAADVSCKLSAGSMIAGKYEVTEPLNVSTGEADLYICKYNDEEYVAKVYRRRRAVKPEVLTALKSIDSPYVPTLYDTGEYNGLPFVILPYYKNGSLQGRKLYSGRIKEYHYSLYQ
ncbi:MAG: hypothetical protein K2P59_11940 [Acetatifactor sp.]|nr:hypothetical protein [Acetatifactor sp.]